MLFVAKVRQFTVLQLGCDAPGCEARSPAVGAPTDPDEWNVAVTRAAHQKGWRVTHDPMNRRLLVSRCPRCAGTNLSPPQLHFLGIA